MIETLHFFTTRGWSFNARGLPEFFEKMTPADQKEYNFDVRQVDWNSYLFDYVMGIKKFLLKENLENLNRSRAHLLKSVILFNIEKLCWIILFQNAHSTPSNCSNSLRRIYLYNWKKMEEDYSISDMVRCYVGNIYIHWSQFQTAYSSEIIERLHTNVGLFSVSSKKLESFQWRHSNLFFFFFVWFFYL